MPNIRINHRGDWTLVYCQPREYRVEQMFYISRPVLKKAVNRFCSGVGVDLAMMSDKFCAALFSEAANRDLMIIIFEYKQNGDLRKDIEFIRFRTTVRGQDGELVFREILKD